MIVGIIIGSLIIFSVLYCIGRCLCCGAECVCCCFRCCAGGCGGGKKNNEKQGYPAPGQPFPYNGQYQSHAMPMYGAAPAFSAPRGAQTATFESPSRPALVHEDSLPAMPSWEHANSKKVEVFEEQHEMNDLGSRGNDIASAQPMLPHSTLSPATTPGQFGSQNAPGSNIGYAGPMNHSSEALSPHGSQVGGYRGATSSPAPGAYGGAAPRNQYGNSNGGYDRIGNNDSRGPYNPYHSPRNPSSPLYAPSGSTAYDPPYSNNNSNNRSQSPYASSPAPRSNPQGWGSQQQQSYGQNQSQSQGYGGYASQSPYGASRQDQYGSSQQNNDGYGGMQGGGRKAVPNSWRDI